MAKKHVINYYNQVQELYFELLADVKDFDEALRDGHVTQEQADEASQMLFRVKDNYERLSYIIMLLNQPTRNKKIKKHESQHKEVYGYLNHVSKDVTLDKMQDDLKKFKEFIRKEKRQ